MRITEIGAVWANMLHHVNATLVDKYGFSTVAMTNPDGSEGNIVFLHLLIDALALQPVNPTCEPISIFNLDAYFRSTTDMYTLLAFI